MLKEELTSCSSQKERKDVRSTSIWTKILEDIKIIYSEQTYQYRNKKQQEQRYCDIEIINDMNYKDIDFGVTIKNIINLKNINIIFMMITWSKKGEMFLFMI